MDYRDIIESISSQTIIINKTLSQTQKVYREILSPALVSTYNATRPALSKIYENLRNIAITTTTQASPIISAIRELAKQLYLPSFASLLKNTNNLSSRLLEVYNTCRESYQDTFRDTIFETGAESVDETTCEKIIADSVVVTRKLSQTHDKSPIKRRAILKKIFKFLLRAFESVLFPLFLVLLTPYWQDFYNEHIQPSVYYSELAEMQEENPDSLLRLVIKDTLIYAGRRMKRVVALVEKYEIVEVLQDCGKIIQVKIFGTDEIGWMYKKYTKRSIL